MQENLHRRDVAVSSPDSVEILGDFLTAVESLPQVERDKYMALLADASVQIKQKETEEKRRELAVKRNKEYQLCLYFDGIRSIATIDPQKNWTDDGDWEASRLHQHAFNLMPRLRYFGLISEPEIEKLNTGLHASFDRMNGASSDFQWAYKQDFKSLFTEIEKRTLAWKFDPESLTGLPSHLLPDPTRDVSRYKKEILLIG